MPQPLPIQQPLRTNYWYRNIPELDNLRYEGFVKSLPENLRNTNPKDYNMFGYWDALGRPTSFDYSQPKESDNFYHAFSRHPLTGEILKSPNHPTFRLAIEEDMKSGYMPYVSPQGKVYTFGKEDVVPEGYKPYQLPPIPRRIR